MDFRTYQGTLGKFGVVKYSIHPFIVYSIYSSYTYLHSIHASIRKYVQTSIFFIDSHKSFFLSFLPSIHPPTHPSIHPSIQPSIHPSIHLSVCLIKQLYIHLFFFLPSFVCTYFSSFVQFFFHSTLFRKNKTVKKKSLYGKQCNTYRGTDTTEIAIMGLSLFSSLKAKDSTNTII